MFHKSKLLYSLVCSLALLRLSPANAASAFEHTTSSAVSLPNDAQATQVITQIQLQPGSWIIFGKASVVSFHNSDIVRCMIMDGGGQLDASATQIGPAANRPLVATVSVQAAVNTVQTTAISLSCQHDNVASGLYVDPGASLIAFTAPAPVSINR